MANERYDENNPLHIELVHRNGKFAGYIDCERDMLLLFDRGLVMKYPISKLIAQARRRAGLVEPQAVTTEPIN